MDWQAWFMLVVVGLMFVALARNWGSPDVLLLGAAVAAGLGGILTPAEVFGGFANENMLTVAALYVVAAALRETGGLDLLGARMLGKAVTERAVLLRMAVVLIVTSAFLNNTPIVAMFLPVIAEWCRKRRVSPSRLLIPLSFLSILGGVCTMIGTSTNLVVNGLMSDWAKTHAGSPLGDSLRPMWLFELGKVGLPLAIIGTLFLLTIGRRLLPNRTDLLEHFGESSREYVVDMMVQPGCRLIGQRVEEAGLRHLPGLYLIEITRKDKSISPVSPDELLREGDRLSFTGVVSTIVDLERISGLVPVLDEGYETRTAERRDRRLCEAVISGTSPLVGKNIRDGDFRARYNAAIIAVHRGGKRIEGRIGDIVIEPGDTMLLQTTPHFARAHRNNPDFYLVSGLEEARPVRHERSWVAIGLLVVLIGLMASGVIKEVLAAFLIGGVMIATRCISSTTARQSMDWQTLVAIGASFGLGRAIENSGLAAVIADALSRFVQTWGPSMGPIVALAIIYLVGVVFSEILTNNASAALVFPFAIATAEACGANPRAFAMAVAISASCAFSTPIGYQTHMMVWGPGGYKFSDFIKVGLPLDIVCWIAAVVLIPLAWPLR